MAVAKLKLAGAVRTLPFFLAALLPFGVGTLLAGVSGFPVQLGVMVAGLVAVAALTVAAFAAREVFAPGVGRCPALGLPVPAAGRLASLSLAIAACMGLLLQFWWPTGEFTMLLGALGALGGYFYFAPPLYWHRRGLGEAAGAVCFGVLPVIAGLYLQRGQLLTEALLYGLPLSFNGFNLFLLYGFPEAAGKPQVYGLGARWGTMTLALAGTIGNVLTIAALVFILLFPASALPLRPALWALVLLAVVNQELLKRQAYKTEARLLLLCRLTLALQLGMGLLFTLMLWERL
jgi:1,4-dihydroxy-2-naphthoate octaprenyltransferase